MSDSLTSTDYRTAEEVWQAVTYSYAGTESPYDLYRILRERFPHSPAGDSRMVISRYDDCHALLSDPRLGDVTLEGAMVAAGVVEPSALSMMAQDPPRHTRLRELANQVFRPNLVRSLRAAIAEEVDRLLDQFRDVGDAMELLARPLPLNILSSAMRLLPSEVETVHRYIRSIDVLVLPAPPKKKMAAIAQGEALDDLLEHKVATWSESTSDPARPDHGFFIDGLFGARDGGDGLMDAEIVTMLRLFTSAGTDTTANLIGNGLHALLNNPEQMELLWTKPQLVRSAVNEMLRYDSPVPTANRIVLEPITIAGEQLAVGDKLLVILASANRDPSRFPEPDEFKVDRGDGPGLAFGHGPHRCVGEFLARTQAEEALNGLIRRFSSIAPAGRRPYCRGSVVRGIQQCPIAVTPR